MRSLFHTLVYDTNLLQPEESLFQELQKESLQIRSFDEEGQEWSADNYPSGFTSYASRNDLFYMSSTFRELEEKIRPCAYDFAEALGYDMEELTLTVSDMWVNIMGPGCVHTGHIHPLSFISGTYYVSMPKGASAIRFEDPRLGLQMACPPRRLELEDSLLSFVSHQPAAGDLVLFESWLRHEVPPHSAEEERVTVSFNYHWSHSEDQYSGEGCEAGDEGEE